VIEGTTPIRYHVKAGTRRCLARSTLGRVLLAMEPPETRARMIAEALAVTREEWARMAADGPTEAEMVEAVAYMTGSLPLQFTDSRRIANTLLGMQQNKRPLDWLDGRSDRLRAVSRDDAARVARRLLKPEALSVTVAGRPVGL
jgi:zinc protease